MRHRTVLTVALVLSIGPVSAAEPAVEQVELLGSIGPYRVGANLTIRDDRELVAGHYFYADKLIDIPLTGTVAGETMTLHEPSGASFDLHFETDDKAARHPFDVATSTALAGTWTGDGHSFPVRLGFDQVGGRQGVARYKAVTAAPAPVFEALVRRFLHGAITGDRAGTAAAVSFPLRVNGATPAVVRDRAQLEAGWSRIFTPCFVAELRTAIPHEMFVRNGAAMVADGAAWFDAHGASSLNLPRCGGG